MAGIIDVLVVLVGASFRLSPWGPLILASPAGAKIIFCPYKGPRIIDNRCHPLVDRLGGDGFGEKFYDARVAGLGHPPVFRISRQHDDRHEGIGRILRGADQTNKIQPVQWLHVPVNQDHVGAELLKLCEGFCGVGNGDHIPYIKRQQNFDDQRCHMLVVVDHHHFDVVQDVACLVVRHG